MFRKTFENGRAVGVLVLKRKGKRFQAYNGNFGHVRETFGKPHNGLQDQLLHGFAPGLGRCVWRRSAAQIVPS
jgi:hypothetical protein